MNIREAAISIKNSDEAVGHRHIEYEFGQSSSERCGHLLNYLEKIF